MGRRPSNAALPRLVSTYTRRLGIWSAAESGGAAAPKAGSAINPQDRPSPCLICVEVV